MITIHSEQTEYGLIEVRDDKAQRGLFVDNVCQGRMRLSDKTPVSPYMTQILWFIGMLYSHDRNIWVLGGGAFLLPTALNRMQHNVTVIEQNKRIHEIAQEFFWCLPVPTLYEDAKDGLKMIDTGTPDIIISDLFNGSTKDPMPSSVPLSFLRPGGIFLDNRFTDGVTFRIKE